MRDSSLPHRRPVRAAFALSGGGALGAWLAAASRELVVAIRAHNAAVADPTAGDDDPRLLSPRWGRIAIDALGGTSAGALVAAQTVRGIFEPSYLGAGRPVDEAGTMTGDWVHGASLEALAGRGRVGATAGPVEAPGWTVLSGAALYELCVRTLGPGRVEADEAAPLDETGFVGVGITLTDLLGFHEPAEFDDERVLGHPDYGAAPCGASRVHGRRVVRDLGGKGHAEVRRLFVARDDASAERARTFLLRTRRRGLARVARWGGSARERLAAVCTASAALPLAVGPLALNDFGGSTEHMYRRLYMDGGILNNKPLAPALRLARWHDLARLQALADDQTGAIDPDAAAAELDYERVVFFVDAFPDRCVDEWRSAHPDALFSDTGTYQLTDDANVAREERIRRALATPFGGMSTFFESIMSTLRAQDLREIAKTNAQLAARDVMIDRFLASPPPAAPSFAVDSPERAAAYAAVRSRPGGAALDRDAALAVAALVAESDAVSELAGRRVVTLVPVFAPPNLREAYAGDAMYALGGLLSPASRAHDANLGVEVARRVVAAVAAGPDALEPARHPPAPASVLPRDATPLRHRLLESARALIDGLLERSPVYRFFAKLPLHVPFVVRRFGRWLDRQVGGKAARGGQLLDARQMRLPTESEETR
jgi:predicted acylesterase/phospholipase RssA